MRDKSDPLPSPRWSWWLIGSLVTGMLIYAGNRVAEASHKRYDVRITWTHIEGYQATGWVRNVSDHDVVGLEISSACVASYTGDLDSTTFSDAEFPMWSKLPRQNRVLHPQEEQPFSLVLETPQPAEFPLDVFVSAFPSNVRPRCTCSFTQWYHGRGDALRAPE